MKRICPKCGSINTRRSSTPAAEITWRNDFLSLYRCRDCTLQFSAISSKTYRIALGVVVAIVAVVLIVLLFELLASRPVSAPKQQRRSDALPQERVLAVADTRFDGVARNAL